MNELERWSDEMSMDPSQGTGQGFDVVGMLKRRKWWIIVCSLIGLGGGYAYFTLAAPIYESGAQLIIVQRQADLPTTPSWSRGKGGEFTVGGDELATQAEMIVSIRTLAKALEDGKLEELPTLENQDKPLQLIVDNLQVNIGGRGSEDASVVNLSFRSESPTDCAKVLQSIVVAYQDNLGLSFKREGTEMLKLISNARDTLQNQLASLINEYQQERNKDPSLAITRDGQNGNVTLSETRLLLLEKQIAELEAIRTMNQARLASLSDAVASGMDPEALYVFMIRTTNKLMDPGERQNEMQLEKLFALQEEKARLMHKYGPNHPDVINIEESIKSFSEMYQPKPAEEGDEEETDESRSAKERFEYVMNYIKSLEHEIKEEEAQIASLTTLSNTEKEKLRGITELQSKLEQIKERITQVRELHSAVVKRVEETSMMSNYGGMSAEVITPPAYGTQVAPKLLFALLLGGGAGFATGFGLAFLLEKADKSFRSPEQIRRELGLPVVGHIPVIMAHEEIGETAEKLDPILCTYYLPRSRYSEAYRAVRTALYFSTQYRDHNVIQITGANKDDGKSTLAANLAICIAQSGKRVLLVDADFRRPTISRLFGLQNDVGLSSVIKGVAEVPEVTQRTPVENLSVMVCGPKPNNPAELLTSPRFKELIDLLRDQYDFVIFDSPPLLAVTDASVIAARVDGVLLGLQITKRGRPAALEATEKLDAIGAKILGVVVNGIGWKRAYAYRYGGNFGAQSKFYHVGSETDHDGQGYIYGDNVEAEALESEKRRAEPAALATSIGEDDQS